MIVSVKEGERDGQPVWWVVSVTKTGTHKIACCDDKETAEAVAATMRGDK